MNLTNKLFNKVSQPPLFFTLIFCLLILSRLLATPLHTASNEFMWDGMLDACSKTWQFITGQRIEGNDNCYLSFFIHFLTSYFLGYSSINLQGVTILLTSIAMTTIVLAVKRILGTSSALIFSGLVLTSTAFIGHGILPSNMPTALYGLSITLYSLTLTPSLKRDAILGFSILLVTLGYAAGVVTVFPLLIFHFLLFRKSWSLKHTLIAGSFCACSLSIVWYIRKLIAGSGDLSHWAVGEIGIPNRDEYLKTIHVMLKDLFINADSWYALSLGSPYLSISLSTLLFTSLILLFYRLITKSTSEIDKWCLVFLGATIIAVLLAAINPGTPGVRRIYPTTLLLFAIISALPSFFPKFSKIRNSLYIIFALLIACEGFESYRRISSNLGPAHPISWIRAAEDIKLKLTNIDQPKIIIVDKEYESALDRIFCNLYLDRDIRKKTISFYGIEVDMDGNFLLSKNGANPEMLTSKISGDGLIFTNNESRRSLIQNALGLNNKE